MSNIFFTNSFSARGRFNHSSLMTQETLQMLVDPHHDLKPLTQIFSGLMLANPALVISQDNLRTLLSILKPEHVPKILQLLNILKYSRPTLVTQDNLFLII